MFVNPTGFGDEDDALSRRLWGRWRQFELSGIAYLQLGIGTFATFKPLAGDLWRQSWRASGDLHCRNCTKKTSSK